MNVWPCAVIVGPAAVFVTVSCSVLAGSTIGDGRAAVYVTCMVWVDAGMVVKLVKITVEASCTVV